MEKYKSMESMNPTNGEMAWNTKLFVTGDTSNPSMEGETCRRMKLIIFVRMHLLDIPKVHTICTMEFSGPAAERTTFKNQQHRFEPLLLV